MNICLHLERCVYMNAKSTSSIAQMLGYIEWKGYIKRYPAHARAITILMTKKKKKNKNEAINI